MFAALMGAIVWNLIFLVRRLALQRYVGMPSSSSHALVGGHVGAAIAHGGFHDAECHGLRTKPIEPALASPLIAFGAAWAAILIGYRIVGRLRPGPVGRGYRLGQLASGGLLAAIIGAAMFEVVRLVHRMPIGRHLSYSRYLDV